MHIDGIPDGAPKSTNHREVDAARHDHQVVPLVYSHSRTIGMHFLPVDLPKPDGATPLAGSLPETVYGQFIDRFHWHKIGPAGGLIDVCKKCLAWNQRMGR